MMKTMAENFADFDYSGLSLINGSAKETMVARVDGLSVEALYDEWVEVTDEWTGYHYSEISTSLYTYADGSYGIMEG